ncbi:nucleolar complex protein 4 isoform X1, partial [Biomphalaria glabrata]
MDQEKISSFVKKIKTKTKLILKDLKNANLIIDLLACAQEENKLILCASCQALGTVFLHYVSAKPFLKGDKTAVSAEDANKEDQVSSWLKDQFTATCDVLCDFLSHESLEVKKISLKVISSLLQTNEVNSSQNVVGTLIEGIIGQLIKSDIDQTDIIGEVPVLWNAADKSSALISLCLVHIRKQMKSVVQ